MDGLGLGAAASSISCSIPHVRWQRTFGVLGSLERAFGFVPGPFNVATAADIFVFGGARATEITPRRTVFFRFFFAWGLPNKHQVRDFHALEHTLGELPEPLYVSTSEDGVSCTAHAMQCASS